VAALGILMLEYYASLGILPIGHRSLPAAKAVKTIASSGKTQVTAHALLGPLIFPEAAQMRRETEPRP